MKFDIGGKAAGQKGAVNKKGKKGKVSGKVGPATTQGTSSLAEMKEKDEDGGGVQSSDGLLLDPNGDSKNKKDKN